MSEGYPDDATRLRQGAALAAAEGREPPERIRWAIARGEAAATVVQARRHAERRVNSACNCAVVGRCPRCGELVCFGHHRNVADELAISFELAVDGLRPDPVFTGRCPAS